MKALIFAAGLGTRLKPLTDIMPKALVPVDGKPLLRHVLDTLEAAGYDDITINAHHFAEQIYDYVIHSSGLEEQPGPGVHISDERDLLRDTGGGILHAERYLRDGGNFLVHNVDIFSNLDIPAFVASARPDALATLVVSDRPTSRYLLFDNDMRLRGWTNVKTGEVRSPFVDFDPTGCARLAFSGIHLISDRVFGIMKDGESPEKFSIIDFYLSVAADFPVYGYVQPGYRMLDVGKLDSIALAESFRRSL